MGIIGIRIPLIAGNIFIKNKPNPFIVPLEVDFL